MKPLSRIGAVAAYAIAMAWVEASVVYYLRTLVNRIEPHQANPLPLTPGIGEAELVREAATLLMLGVVGWLAGRNAPTRMGFALLAFGIWDVFYYVFLRVLTPWPSGVLDWDILFLLPLPWWGPVIAPVAIAFLMMVTGVGLIYRSGDIGRVWHRPAATAGAVLGVFIALGVFMNDALHSVPHGTEAVRQVLPQKFNWGWFAFGYALMALPAVQLMQPRTTARPESAQPAENPTGIV